MGEESFKDTDTTERNGEHIPISTSFSSNIAEQPGFLCNAHLHHLVAYIVTFHENLACHSKLEKMKTLFCDIETTIKIKLDRILKTLSPASQRR